MELTAVVDACNPSVLDAEVMVRRAWGCIALIWHLGGKSRQISVEFKASLVYGTIVTQ